MNLNLRNSPFQLLFIIYLNYIICVEAMGKYNISFEEMHTCKEYDLPGNGYLYTKFFEIHALDNNNLAKDERLHLKFYVMSTMDAHILLSVTDHPRPADSVYEIVIGAGQNTFSAIRTNMGRRRVATNQDQHLLSIFDPTPIEIIQNKAGELKVFIPGFKEEPILYYNDKMPLNINYVSFSTFGNIRAKWFYDCQFDGFDSELEEEIFPLTPYESLIEYINTQGENITIPMNLRAVNFAFQIRAVAFDQYASTLQARMNLILYWIDDNLKWNVSDFDGINTIVQPSMDIWKPNIVILNGAMESIREFNPAHELKIHANGSISMFATNVQMTTWCMNQARNWPMENLHCELLLGLNELTSIAEEPLKLTFDQSKPLSKEPISTLTGWRFTEIAVTNVAGVEMNRFNERGILQTMGGDVILDFTMKRNSSYYKDVFYMPIIVCEILLLLSFLLSGYRRGALILVVFVVVTLGLMFITKHAPPAYVPYIMHTYQHIMRITTFCYMLHIAVMWLMLYPPSYKPYNWIMSILNTSAVRLMLCMRLVDGDKYVIIQEKPWKEIAKIFNALSFIVVMILFIIFDTKLNAVA